MELCNSIDPYIYIPVFVTKLWRVRNVSSLSLMYQSLFKTFPAGPFQTNPQALIKSWPTYMILKHNQHIHMNTISPFVTYLKQIMAVHIWNK